MNFTHYLTLTLGTAIGGITATASTFDELTRTGVVWATGVSKEEGWYDANKNDPWDGDADDLMCYAACAANLVAWWQNGEYGKKLTSSAPGDIDSIWKKYVTSNLLDTAGGDPAAAINWWISGVYAPTGTAEWERYYAEKLKEDLPLTLAPFSGYYFNQYGLSKQDLSDFIFDAWLYGEWSKDGATTIDFKALFENGAGISLAIASQSTGLGHGVTLWGVEYINGILTKLWITDSDDFWISESPQLFSANVSIGEDGKIYLTGTEHDTEDWLYYGSTDVYIDSVYAINSAESAKWKLAPEPTTVTLSLLALATLAARRRRRASR